MRIFALNNIAWKRPFFVTFLCVTFAAALFWLDTFRAYEAETKVLVIGKSASVDAHLAAGNLAETVGSIAFYERTLEENAALEDTLEGYLPDRRRILWNEKVLATQGEQGSVIVLRARGTTSEETRLLAKGTALTLFSVAGTYYNVKTDLDLRMVDQPVVRTFVVTPFLYAGASFGTGFLVTAFFFTFLHFIPRVVGSKKNKLALAFGDDNTATNESFAPYAIGDTVPYSIDPRKFIPEKPTMLSFETESEIKVQESLPRVTTKAVAPANLPVADELDVAEQSEPMPQEVETALTENSFLPWGEHEIVKSFVLPTQKADEPTIQEYKRRLNELLAGGK